MVKRKGRKSDPVFLINCSILRYITQAAGNKAYIVGAQVLGGELWFN